MPELPFAVSKLLTIAFVSLTLSVLTFLFLILNRIRRTVRRAQGKPAKHGSISGNVARFTFTLFWIAVSAAVFFFAALIQSYVNFTKQEQVAIVRCTEVSEGDRVMQLEFTPVVHGKVGESQGYLLKGDQWAVEGNILKWDDWLNFAGIHTMYRLTRLRGRYLNAEEERRQPASVYDLEQGEDILSWPWLMKYGHRLKFVQAVYGNTVYTFPSANNLYYIYVTTSGLSLRVREAL